MSKPLVSIVIPAYNEEKNISRCLKSIKEQDYDGSYEVIVCNNNSSDRTAQVALDEGARVVFEERAGVIFAREAGTKVATGEIIVQTDADSYYEKNWLSRIIETFDKNPDVVAVIGSFKFYDGPAWGQIFSGLLFGITNIVYKINGKMIYIPGANTAFKRKYFHGYNLKLDQGGDEVALLKELKKEGKILFLRNNAVLTSARRLRKGLLYNIFVILIFYYIFDYTYRRLTGKSLTAVFPRIRDKEKDFEHIR